MNKVSNNRYNAGQKRKQTSKQTEIREEDEYDDEDDMRSDSGTKGSK